MRKHFDYVKKVAGILDKILETQSEIIECATDMLFDAFKSGRSFFVFGATHAGMFTEEMYARAGGLMVANPIFYPSLMTDVRPFTLTSETERLEGLGQIILNGAPIHKGDVLILHSVSGRNAVAIDMALEAKKKGIKIICVTNLNYSRSIGSRHSSGKLLCELADIVIDNCGDFGDACIPVGTQGVSAGATSTVAGAVIANMLAVGFAERCEEAGIEPPVFESANTDSGQERTVRMVSEYFDRIHYL